jgi:large subunit ribosomal protein L23
MTKNGLKAVFQEYFGIKPLKVNSMRVKGKVKRFKGIVGKRADSKKFYVLLPEDAKIESLAV